MPPLSAIDACHDDGGGTVLIPAGGVFRSGTVVLRCNVELHLERGAVLTASPDINDFGTGYRVSSISDRWFVPGSDPVPVFITARNATNVGISGSSMIEGGGRDFVLEDLGLRYRVPDSRPFTIFLVGCRQSLSVTFKSPMPRYGRSGARRAGRGCGGDPISSLPSAPAHPGGCVADLDSARAAPLHA
jgi:hypothetical protein